MLYLIAILGLSLLIFVHELGHFLSAKAFGMRAEKFYIGFPPAAVKKKIGETEYGIGVVPLGGYVKISGMTREEELPEDVVPRAYYSRPIWQRVITIAAGSAMNVLLAMILFVIFWMQGVPEIEGTTVVAAVQEDSGASRAGLEPGDEILAVDSLEAGSDLEGFRTYLREHPDTAVTLTVERDGQRLTLPATIGSTGGGFLGVIFPATVGANEEARDGLLGVVFDARQTGTTAVPFTSALEHALDDTVMITGLIFAAFRELFASGGEELASPIGIVAFSSETIKLGWEVYLRVLGFISIQLAILNMLPLLPLDGGHVLFNIIEKVRGRPVNREAFERISFVGLMLFVIIFVIGFMNDIERLVGPGFRLEP
ncbi:MAG: RIP metalloprotease [Gaiellales bacterium]|nr:MAG: RIP metalloprotease [Gaiellales bacterium]